MQTYSHSGAVPVGGAVETVVAGVLTAVVGGIIYAYGFHWIPLIYLNILLTLGYAGAMGLAIAIAARRGRIRNNLFLRVVALLVALVGLYSYWAAYLWALAGIGNVGLRAFWPGTLVGFAGHLFANGSWGIKNLVVTGWPLVAIWVIETVTIVRVCMSAALANAQRPYCESCDAWTDVEADVARLAATGEEPAWQQVFAGDLPSLAEFPPAPPGVREFVRLGTARCPRCEHSRFLTASAVQIKLDKKGKESVKERQLLTNAILTPSQFAVVEACSQLYQQQSLENASAASPAAGALAVESPGEGEAVAAEAAAAPVNSAPVNSAADHF
jgi:hypothetical protein